MSAREWQPGDVALVRVKKQWYRALRDQIGWIVATDDPANGDHLETCADVNYECRPLVVIDPDRVMVDGGFDANHLSSDSLSQILTNVANHLDENDDVPAWVDVLRALSSAIAPPPPKPDEPTGLGAVVEDADGNKWVRTDRDTPAWTQWDASLTRLSYANVKAVRILSEGVPS